MKGLLLALLSTLVLLMGCSAGDPLPEDLYARNIYPGFDNVSSLGSDSLWWNTLYVDTIYSNSGGGSGNLTVHSLAGVFHSASSLADLNGLVSDATLDDSGDPRTPSAHTIVSHSDTTATGAELDELTDGSVTSLHSHPVEEAGAVDTIKAGTVTTNGGAAYVAFNTPFSSTDYAIALTAISGADTVICMWYDKAVGGFSLVTDDDGGKTESGVVVLWVVVPYDNS